MTRGFGRAAVVLARLAVLAAAACSAPYPTKSPEVIDSRSGRPLDGLISFCYGTEMNSREEVKSTAAEHCDGELVFVEQKVFLNDCPLLQTARVTYQCRPGPRDGSGGQSAAPRP